MGSIGNPIITGLVQAAQAQQVASKDRDRARSTEESARERADRLDLRVDEAEAAEPVRALHDDDEPKDDRRKHSGDEPAAAAAEEDAAPGDLPPEDRPSLDLTA
jgi:hypothetical protein